MNFKAAHLLRAVCAVAALGAFSGTASADCLEIQSFVRKNTDKVATALFALYGDAERKVELGPNHGDYEFMTLRSKPTVIDVKGCTVQLELLAQKEKPPSPDSQVSSARPKRAGKVKLDVGFDEREGLQLCVKSNRVSSVDWIDEGIAREKAFVSSNRNKPYFSGCLF